MITAGKHNLQEMLFRILSFSILAVLVWVPPAKGQTEEKGYAHIFQSKSASPLRYGSMVGPQQMEGFDVLHYLIDIAIDPGTRTVDGSVAAEFEIIEAQLDTFFLHLRNTMNVDSVLLDGISVAFLRSAGFIKVPLGGGFAIGDTVNVKVFYQGQPVEQGLRFYQKCTYSINEPDMARNWFPCYDEPWDKATSEMVITIPDSLFCASNGLMLSAVDNLDGTKTFHWKTNYPHTTYTISVAISAYDFFSHWYKYSATDSMEMPYYVYPEKLVQAQVSFSNAPAMMAFFGNTFGEYPFIDEAYGTAIVDVNGAMENFTCTSYGAHLVNGGHDYDWVVAHEMAHSWFGNSITMLDWPDIWLNEGFATYGDALWSENAAGKAEYLARMEFFKQEYFNEDAQNRFPIYDPQFLWGATVYEKGAWILHMLRYLLGDTDFFSALNIYNETFKYGSATTEDFRQVCETVSSLDLSAFFNEWIYQAGYPEYKLSWWSYDFGGTYEVVLHLEQSQQDAPLFTIPVEIEITATEGDTIIVLPVSGFNESYRIQLQNEPVSIAFDPRNWILKKYEEVPSSTRDEVPSDKLQVIAYPNPAGVSIKFDFFLPEGGLVVIEVFDVLGRKVGEVFRGEKPALWNTAVWELSSWPGNKPAGGIYFYKLRSGNKIATGKLAIVR